MTMFFEVRVLDRADLTPGMVRLTFGGPEDFPGTGVPDEYLRLFFPDPETGRLHLPVISDEGRWTYPDGGPKAVHCSTYTVRAHRGVEIDIDFVIHDGGVASDWARRARPGDRVTVNRPRGLYAPPADMCWQLLMADATGIPALARILEQTPAQVRSRVFVEVADPAHELVLPYHPAATITWLHRAGNGVAPSRLPEVFEAMPLPPTPGYIWVAAEQKAVRAIRRRVRQVLGLPAGRYELVGYWIHEGEAWEAKWDALPEEVKAAIEAGWESDRDGEEVMDEYEATLERYGL